MNRVALAGRLLERLDAALVGELFDAGLLAGAKELAGREGHDSDNHTDDELELIENAFEYLIKKKYPPGCSKNQKRVIRRKAERLEERNGEIFYKKRGGSMVNLSIPCQLFCQHVY